MAGKYVVSRKAGNSFTKGGKIVSREASQLFHGRMDIFATVREAPFSGGGRDQGSHASFIK